MYPTTSGDRRGLRLRLSLLLAGGALALTGCAAIPAPEIGAPPRSSETFDTAASLPGTGAAWPGDGWWRSYGDPQLNRLIEEALANAPDMRAAEARTRRALAMVAVSRADLLPSGSAGASAQADRQSYNMGFPAPRGWNDNGRAALDLSWELDFWGKNRAAFAAATSDSEAARAEQAAARLGLSSAIAAQYAALAALHADRDAALEAVTVRTRTAELMQGRQERGLENEGAVRRAVSARAAAQANLAAIDESIGLSRNALAALLGAGPDRGLTIARPSARLAPAVALPDAIPAQLMGRRPDIAAARARAEAASSRITVAEKRFYPNINLAGIIGLQSLNLASFAEGDSLFGSAGAAISLPIFQGGRLKAGYRSAEAEYDLAVSAYDAAVAQGLREVADAATSRRALDTRLRHTREAHVAAQAAWQIADNRYRGGLATYLDVLSAEDALIAARRELASLETRALSLDIALVRALGGGFGA